jgi:hypothetical protein
VIPKARATRLAEGTVVRLMPRSILPIG